MLIITQSCRRSWSVRDAWLAAAAAAALLTMAAPGARADEPDALARAHAQRIAITVCGTCHGPDGNSMNPKYPRLAGQNANYLAAQLKAFRAQSRGDSDAIGYMWGMASQLDDATITALAEFYAGQRAGAPERVSAVDLSRGKD
ncbi:MAG TPA: cytochrome c, partial [Steroidobacteraceae bacterium]|nr:cytochrome c [Steroidobacteraceae bacterium]